MVRRRYNLRDIVEEAAEYGRRFPDEYDSTILDFMGDLFNTEYTSEMVIGRIILVAYNSGEEIAFDHAARIYGIDMR